jgi:hypothetical protein
MSPHADQSAAKNSQRLVGALVVGSGMVATLRQDYPAGWILQRITIAMQ